VKFDRLVCACGGMIALLLVALPAHRAEAQTWEVYTYSPVANAPVRGLQRIIDAMQTASGGSLTMKLHLGGSLQINATTITQSVADGVIQLGDDIFFTGSIPMSGVARLPMLIRDPAEFAKVAPIIDKYMIPAYAKKGIVALGQYIYPLQTAWSRRELTKPAQFQGLKMRVTSPEQGEVLRLFGGSSVTMQPSEVPAAIDRGVIDGAFTASSGSGYSWRDLIHYNYRLGLNFVNSYIIVNKDAFDALSPALQAKLRAVVADTLVWNAEQMRQDEIDLTQKIAAGGVDVVQPTPADVQDVEAKIAPYWDQWAKAHGPDAVAALHAIRTTLGR
jgi:TRAP-type C4-dicarboxylate transport system substrate-binding protein